MEWMAAIGPRRYFTSRVIATLFLVKFWLGGASGAGAYALGMVSDAFSSMVFTTLAVVVSATGAIVVGFPVLQKEGHFYSKRIDELACQEIKFAADAFDEMVQLQMAYLALE